MGRKTLIALWISACTVAGLPVRHNGSTKVRQYRNAPQGVYASVYANAAPYGSFSFNTPTSAPESTTPADKQEAHNRLKDSYGNTIQSLPYTFPQQFFQFPKFTAAQSYNFPQGLPTPWPWASSPLTSVMPIAPSFVSADPKNGTQWDWSQFETLKDPNSNSWNQFKTTNAQDSNSNYWNQIKTTNAQDLSSNYWNQFDTTKDSNINYWNQFENTKDLNNNYWNQLGTTKDSNSNYWKQFENTKDLNSNYWNQFETTKDPNSNYWNQFETTKDPNSNYWNQFETTNAQDSNRKLVYAAQGFNWLRQPKFQWLDDKPRYHEYNQKPRYRTPHSLKEKVQTPIKHTVKTNYDGKDIVVQLETKPPLPLVDLRLLEPVKTDGIRV